MGSVKKEPGRFLLDTHVILWWLFDEPNLSQNARAVISDPDNTIFVSSATGCEIATKYRLGKLSMPRRQHGTCRSC